MRVRGVDLALRDTGSGTPFLWGHGLLGSMEQEDDAALFDFGEMAAGRRLLRFDARGHGRSEATLAPDDYRWPSLARDLLGLADALGLDRAVLGGVSMGAATALHAALAASGRAAALVLAGPPTAWSTRPRQARLYRVSAGMVGALGLAPFRGLAGLAGLGASNPTLAAMQRSVMRSLRRADARAVEAALRGAARSDLPDPERLRRLEVPALILAWSGDRTHPVSTAERLAELLPDAALHVARDAAELGRWATLVQRFLAERAPADPDDLACGARGG
ncbi:MAG: alpha/beta hydrolase [Myxococcota bacterium]|nr:alpha/beta hydrolase [Myxococcota bacterium]